MLVLIIWTQEKVTEEDMGGSKTDHHKNRNKTSQFVPCYIGLLSERVNVVHIPNKSSIIIVGVKIINVNFKSLPRKP